MTSITLTPGQRIERLRAAKGLPQGAPGLSQGAWSKIERGQVRHPRMRAKMAIAAKLGVTVEDIWPADGIPPALRETQHPEWAERVAKVCRRTERHGTPQERVTLGRALRDVLCEIDPGVRHPDYERTDLDEVWALANSLCVEDPDNFTPLVLAWSDGTQSSEMESLTAYTRGRVEKGQRRRTAPKGKPAAARTAPRTRGSRRKPAKRAAGNSSDDGEPHLAARRARPAGRRS